MKRPRRSSEMAQNQSGKVLWCCGKNADQDVSIRLVTDANNKRVTRLRSRGTLAELKVHSNELKNCSKYFDTCMSTRWADPNSSSAATSMEFTLEMIHGLHVSCYADCFSRMYTPLRKDFKDVKSSLELLRVASQIEFLKLISSICEYLSAIKWSVEDELRIRQYSSSPDFSRAQAEGLVARLALRAPSEEDGRRVVCDLTEKGIRIALHRDKHDHVNRHIMSFEDARSFFEEFFANIGQNAVSDASSERDMVVIVSNVAKEMLVEFDEECRKQATIDSELPIVDSIENVHDFGRKLEAICWILKKLLRAQMAQEVVECFLHLEMPPMILESAIGSRSLTYNGHAIELASLVLLIHREAAARNLQLGIPERIALLENWHLIYSYQELSKEYDLLYDLGFEQARDDEVLVLSPEKQRELVLRAWEEVFLTLPSQEQAELLERYPMLGFMRDPNFFSS